MRSVVKIPLVISKQDTSILEGPSRIANWLLEVAKDLRQQCRACQDPKVGRQLNTERCLRDLLPALKAIFSSSLKNAARRLWAAFCAYDGGKKGGNKNPP
jgi:hypothetical protein